MKKLISIILCMTLFALCLNGFAEDAATPQPEPNWDQEISFTGLDDENLLDYMKSFDFRIGTLECGVGTNILFDKKYLCASIDESKSK